MKYDTLFLSWLIFETTGEPEEFIYDARAALKSWFIANNCFDYKQVTVPGLLNAEIVKLSSYKKGDVDTTPEPEAA